MKIGLFLQSVILILSVGACKRDSNLPKDWKSVDRRLDRATYMPEQVARLPLVSFRIPTEGWVNSITFLNGEKYAFSDDGQRITVTGQVNYCILQFRWGRRYRCQPYDQPASECETHCWDGYCNGRQPSNRECADRRSELIFLKKDRAELMASED